MSDISENRSSRWEGATFKSPPEVILARINKKMMVDNDTGEVVWQPGEAPSRKSDDGLVGTLRADGYRMARIGQFVTPVSRIAYYLHNKTWPRGVVRFLNGDASDFSKDNLYDAVDNPIMGEAASPLVKLNEATQKERQEQWAWARARSHAEEVLRTFGDKHLYAEALRLSKDSIIKSNGYSTNQIMGRVVPDDQIDAEAERRVRAGTTREELDWAIRQLGAEPPADIEEAAKLFKLLS